MLNNRKSIINISDAVWEIPQTFQPGMRVPARVYASQKLLDSMDTGALRQIVNVAGLPGIVRAAICMPDGHNGYGFPIGGVAAMDPETGVISPGGIGFDINCGMRLVLTNLTYSQVKPKITSLLSKLWEKVPAGLGKKGIIKINQLQFRRLIEGGSRWCLKQGLAWDQDLITTESRGCFPGADLACVSKKAIERGLPQVGTLGSGNHYLELQVVKPENIFDENFAKGMGLNIKDQVVIMFHCGSRGFGHQIGSDYLEKFLKVMNTKYKLGINDKELAAAPFTSSLGQSYYRAMQCAVNMAFANRQIILNQIREVFSQVFAKKPEDLGMRQVYDVAHNTARLEKHLVKGVKKEVLVHRKGATRAFPPGHPDLPQEYSPFGQPVIIGGSMETGSYLLAGSQAGKETFFTTAHGSGRVMSRAQARKLFNGKSLQKKLKKRGIEIKAVSYPALAEEAGGAYKDIDEVVKSISLAKLSNPVAKLIPIANIKG